MALAFPEMEESNPKLGSWGPMIRRMLGEDAIARLQAALTAGERHEDETRWQVGMLERVVFEHSSIPGSAAAT